MRWWGAFLLLAAGCGDDVNGIGSTLPDAMQPDGAMPDAMNTPDGAAAPGLRVSGNHIVDQGGQLVRLFGVNRSGTEYACIQGNGIFDGPNDDTSLASIRTWK